MITSQLASCAKAASWSRARAGARSHGPRILYAGSHAKKSSATDPKQRQRPQSSSSGPYLSCTARRHIKLRVCPRLIVQDAKISPSREIRHQVRSWRTEWRLVCIQLWWARSYVVACEGQRTWAHIRLRWWRCWLQLRRPQLTCCTQESLLVSDCMDADFVKIFGGQFQEDISCDTVFLKVS